MSSAGVAKTGGVYTYNFTDTGSKTYGYPDGIKQLGSFWAMIGGNGYPDADINTDDLTYSFNSLFGFYDGYYSGDFDLSGQVDTDDLTYIFNPNFGMYGNIADHKKTGFHSMVP